MLIVLLLKSKIPTAVGFRHSLSRVKSRTAKRVKFWVSREVDEFTSGQVTTGTKEPGFDEAFHIMIPLGMTFDWCSAKGGSSPVLSALKNDIEKELMDYELRLRKHYGRKNEDRHLQLKSAFTNYA